MRVHVSYTAEVEDDYRMALSHSWGDCGKLASREDVKSHLERVGSSNDADLMDEWQNCDICQGRTP